MKLETSHDEASCCGHPGHTQK